MPFDDIYLVSENLQLATPKQVASAEAKLGVSFPKGYVEFVTTLGSGEYSGYLYIYMPDQVLKETPKHRQGWSRDFFWEEGRKVLKKNHVLQSVLLGRTIDGDEMIFHPLRPKGIYILPRHSDKIFKAGTTLYQALDWWCESGTLVEKEPFRWFCSGKDRIGKTLLSKRGRLAFPKFRKRLLAKGIHDHVLNDEDEMLHIIVRDFGGVVYCYGGSGIIRVEISYDKTKRTPVLKNLMEEFQEWGLKKTS